MAGQSSLPPKKGWNREYAEMATRAADAGAAFEIPAMTDPTSPATMAGPNSTSGFVRDLRRVIERAHVIIEVLDVRDPNACRNPQVEREIVAQGKKVILLLNKIDLVPK